MNEKTKQAVGEMVNDRYYKKDSERIASCLQQGWAFLGVSRDAYEKERAEIIEYAKSIGAH
jgi:hypothetical protein